LVRVSIKDSEQTVTFLTSEEMVPRLVAGCSINPADLGELLAATETYQRGFAAAIMSDLMVFDKRLRRDGPGFIRQAIAAARESGQAVTMAFQVIDEITEAEALRPRESELLVIDVTGHLFETSEELEIHLFGEVQIHTGEELTEKTVTYILPKEWSIRPLKS